MTLEGYATLEGTARYRDRFKGDAAENHFRLEQNLWLSSIGIGTYLGDWDEETDARYAGAIEQAFKSGANVIDTAANYRFQRSERAIGSALKNLASESADVRAELLICTKGGYLPFDGAPPRDKRQYIEETFVRPGIASFSDIIGSHCMTPAYLASQLDQSLRNMNLSSVDVYYIHNPESQLGAVSREDFEGRLRAAFEYLEQMIAAGKIRMYGVATWNGFRVQPGEREYHSLERLVQLAREVGGETHGFRFIQLPLNLAMPEAYVLENQTLEGQYVSVLEAAAALGVTVVASASILQGRVARGLPEAVREPLGSLATDAQTGIQFVRSAPGITTALVGMSRREHVEENLQLVRVAPTPPEDFQRLFGENEE
jgi:aryl-alcohol dehydrogenase-like predicted oxidoreductase